MRCFLAKERRFSRQGQRRQNAKDVLEAVFHMRTSDRTERRYRRPTNSRPHVNALIQLSVGRGARYTDSLRALHVLSSDQHSRSAPLYASSLVPSNAPLVPVLPLNWYKKSRAFQRHGKPSLSLKSCIIHPSPFHPVLSLSDCKHDVYRPSRIVQCTMELTTRERSSLGSKRLKVL
jgi:hypothetical protein